MTNHIYLSDGQHPPETEDWVLIQQTPSGHFDLMTSTGGMRDVTIGHQTGLFPLSQALDRAETEVKARGLGRIFLKGIKVA